MRELSDGMARYLAGGFSDTALTQAPTAAQTTLGRIAGTVLDSSGGVLPGATITLTNEQTNQVQTTVIGETGAFLFPQVPGRHLQGRHRARGLQDRDVHGRAESRRPGVLADREARARHVERKRHGRSGQSLVPTTSPEVTATVLQRQILDIPLANRDVTNLIKLQPGVQAFINRDQHRHQRRPADVDAGDARRHQHSGQFHPDQLARLPAEPADVRQRRRVLDHDVGVGRRHRGRRDVRCGWSRRRAQPVHGQRVRVQPRLANSPANSFFNNAAIPHVPKPELSRHQFGGRVGGPIQQEQAVLLRQLRGHAADDTDGAEPRRSRRTRISSTAFSATPGPTASSARST